MGILRTGFEARSPAGEITEPSATHPILSPTTTAGLPTLTHVIIEE